MAAATKAEVAYRLRTGLWPVEAAGLRQVRFARSTGTLVGLYDGHAAGISEPGDGEGRWVTICEAHGRLVAHESLELARSHAACPEGFCGLCNGSEEAGAA